MLLLALGLGFVTMELAGMLEDVILGRLQLTARSELARKAALVAGIEDGAKLLVVLLIAYAFRRHVNDPLDGVIYGTFVGLGAALDESLLYLSLAPPTFATFGAELTRMVTHSLLGGLAGFAVGIGARPDGPRRKRPLLVLCSLLVAMLIHFAWNLIAYRGNDPSPLARVLLMGLMLWLMLTWAFLLTIARRRSERLFALSAT